MPDPPDTEELCCGAGVCCDDEKRRRALAKQLRDNDPHLSGAAAMVAADFIHRTYDILPKSLGFGPAFEALEVMARAHPYN